MNSKAIFRQTDRQTDKVKSALIYGTIAALAVSFELRA